MAACAIASSRAGAPASGGTSKAQLSRARAKLRTALGAFRDALPGTTRPAATARGMTS